MLGSTVLVEAPGMEVRKDATHAIDLGCQGSCEFIRRALSGAALRHYPSRAGTAWAEWLRTKGLVLVYYYGLLLTDSKIHIELVEIEYMNVDFMSNMIAMSRSFASS